MKYQLYTLGLAVLAAALILSPSISEACSGCGCSLPQDETAKGEPKEEPVNETYQLH